jgi:hypothetical protein
MSARRERAPGWWCPECKGTGACEDCLGTGSRGYWIKRLCPTCKGERDCTWCGGTGEHPGARR